MNWENKKITQTAPNPIGTANTLNNNTKRSLNFGLRKKEKERIRL